MSMPVDSSLPLVLVAHRSKDTVELLKTLLEGEGYTILCAYNGRSALQFARQHRPILLLLDQALPLVNGLELCRTLRAEEDTAAIFLLTDRPDELGKLLAFAAGADECLPLPFHPRELLARIKAVLWRTRQHTGEQHILRCGALALDPEQRQARANGEAISLTGLEYELLYLLIRHPGRAFSRTQLLERIPGFQQHAPLDRAVDLHISNLRRKLGEAMGSEAAIETVRGVGYRLRVSTSEPSPGQSASVMGEQARLALAAFEHVPLPLLVLTPDRTVVLYNEAARQLCGWSADQVVGQVKCYSLLACHDEEGHMLCNRDCLLRNGALNQQREQTTRYCITLKDGRQVPAVAHYSSLAQPGTEDGYILLALQPDLSSALDL